MPLNPTHCRRAFLLPATVAVFLLISSCSDEDSGRFPPNPAFLGIVANQRDAAGTDPTLAEAYLNIAQGAFACAQFSVAWGEIEPYAGARNWGAARHHGYQARRRGILLSTEVLLLDNRARGSLPADLAGRGWDDPTLRVRLAMFLRDLDLYLKPGSAYLWLGREVDAYFVRNREELSGFIDLLGDVRDSLIAWGVDTPVGVGVGYGESTPDDRLDIADLLASHVDLLGLSVYGRNLLYTQTMSPLETMDLVREAVGRFPDSKLVITGTGYPGDLGSGVPQEEFTRLLTRYLAGPPANLFGAIWFCLHDWHTSLAGVEAGRRHAGEPELEAAYAAQLRSLGIRHVNGVPRPAWYVAQEFNRSAAMSTVAAREYIVR